MSIQKKINAKFTETMNRKEFLIIGSGPASAAYLFGLVKVRKVDPKSVLVITEDRQNPQPKNISFSGNVFRNVPDDKRFSQGISGNMTIWGGRLRELCSEAQLEFEKLTKAEQEFCTQFAANLFGISQKRCSDLVNATEETPFSVFADKEKTIENIAELFSMCDVIYEKVIEIVARKNHIYHIELSSGRNMKVKCSHKPVLVCGAYPNLQILKAHYEPELIMGSEHINLVYNAHLARNMTRSPYNYCVDGAGEAIQCHETVHLDNNLAASLTFSAASALLQCGRLFKPLEKLVSILAFVPAHRALKGWKGKFLNFFVTMFFQSKKKGFITAHMSPTLGAKTHIYCGARPSTGSQSRSVLITQAQSPKTIQTLALKLGKMIEAGGWVKKIDEEKIVVVDANHAMDISYFISDFERIDTGLFKTTSANPTFSLVIFSFSRAVSNSRL
jgi:hypothetical protein